VHGPGNAASGVLGCDGLNPVDLFVWQNSQGGPPRWNFRPFAGGPGSMLISHAFAFGTRAGSCEHFCTDSDPVEQRGTVSLLLFTTAESCSQVVHRNVIGPEFCRGGQPLCCSAWDAGRLTGLRLAAATTVVDAPPVGDFEVAAVLQAK
jgi:hypothetical protein